MLPLQRLLESVYVPPLSASVQHLLNTVLVQDGLICDNSGWCSRLNKGGDIIYDIEIVCCNIVEHMGDNNQVVPAYGSLIGSSLIEVDSGRIL